jgi:hypothetical protein
MRTFAVGVFWFAASFIPDHLHARVGATDYTFTYFFAGVLIIAGMIVAFFQDLKELTD